MKKELIDEQDVYGETLLMRFAYKGNELDVQSLLDQGASIDLKSKKGDTALLCACYRNRKRIVKILLDANAFVDEDTVRKSENHRQSTYQYRSGIGNPGHEVSTLLMREVPECTLVNWGKETITNCRDDIMSKTFSSVQPSSNPVISNVIFTFKRIFCNLSYILFVMGVICSKMVGIHVQKWSQWFSPNSKVVKKMTSQ